MLIEAANGVIDTDKLVLPPGMEVRTTVSPCIYPPDGRDTYVLDFVSIEPDVSDPMGPANTIHQTLRIPVEHYDVDAILEQIRSVLMSMVCHEVDEWLSLDGTRVHLPHGPKHESPPPPQLTLSDKITALIRYYKGDRNTPQ